MAYQKLQPTQALDVILSDTVNPINPSRPAKVAGSTVLPEETNKLTYLAIATAVNTGTQTETPATNKLEDSTATFTTAPAVSVGDTVFNTTNDTLAFVTVVDSATELTLSANIMTTLADGYDIYQGEGFVGKVAVGDLVLNEATATLTAVTAVAQTVLTFGSDVFPSAGANFKVYGNAAQMNTETEAFVVYVGAASGSDATWAEVKVTTAAGNDITFSHFPTGTFLPVQCLRVWDSITTATNVVALW